MRAARRIVALVVFLVATPFASAEERIDVREGRIGPPEALATTWETVRWLWPSNETHGIAPDEGGDAWCAPSTSGCVHVFAEPGEYRYHCPLHPELRGVVHVSRWAGDAAAPLTASFAVLVNGLAVDLDATPSGRSRTAIESYHWSFGDGANGEGRRVRHDYAAPGTYTVLLTVVDEFGDKARSSRAVRLFAAGDPAALFRANATGRAVQFEAPAIEGAHAWDFGDGARVVCQNGCVGDPLATFAASDAAPLHVYTRGGSFVVGHRISFANGTNASAEIPIDVATSDAFLVERAGLTIRADARLLPRYPNATFAWLFGDLERAQGEQVEHTFPQDGRWSIELTLTDDAGSQAILTDVELAADPPEAATARPPSAPRTQTPALAPLLLLALLATLARVSESYK